MTTYSLPSLSTLTLVAATCCLFPVDGARAATAAAHAASGAASAAKPHSPANTSKTAKRTKAGAATKTAKVPERPVELVLPEATAEQIDAAGRVYYGTYDCEFQQTIVIEANAKFPAYVDVHHGKALYVMKPVLSSTGAIRLEDVMADTLMVQIASKSMLLNVNTGHRLVDECVSPGQRLAIEAARLAKLQASVDAANDPASGASGAASSAPAAQRSLLSN